MNINIHTLSTAINAPVGTSVEDISKAKSTDIELQMLQTYIIKDSPQTKDDLETTL